MNRRALVIGYGSTLHGDDGIGSAVIERLTTDPRLAGVALLARHQLTPDLAIDLSAADLVILVDAARDLPPGEVAIGRIEMSSRTAPGGSHRLGPDELVGLAAALFDATPDVRLVTIGAGALELGDPMTAAVRDAIPSVVDAIVGIVTADQAETVVIAGHA